MAACGLTRRTGTSLNTKGWITLEPCLQYEHYNMTFFSCLLATLLTLAPACAAKDASLLNREPRLRLSRLQELRARLLDGQPLRLAALGGSSTAGHRLPRDSPLLYYNRLAGWINESHPHVETLVVNSGTPASGPTYMEKCPPECAQRVGPRMHDGEISSPVLVPRLHTAALAVWPRPWRDVRPTYSITT